MIRTFDKEKINSVLKHPDIWPLIADDEDRDSFEPPMEDTHYLFDEGILFILHPLNDDLEIHANVLPEFRGNARKAAAEALAYGFGLNDKIVARIPIEYGNVYGFALKFMEYDGEVDGIHHFSLEKAQWRQKLIINKHTTGVLTEQPC